jgi:hypothetical protein
VASLVRQIKFFFNTSQFGVAEHSIADFFYAKHTLFLNSRSARGVVGGEDLGCQHTSVSFFAYLSIA